MHLYDLTTDYERVRAMLDDPDIDPQVIYDTLESIQGEAQDKALAIARLLREREADATATEAEAKRLADLARSRRNRADSLKAYLQTHMERMGLDQVKGNDMALRLQNSPAKVVVDDQTRMPSDFLRATLKAMPLRDVPEEWRDRVARVEVDKTAVMEAHRNGYDVPGTHITQERHLRIV